MKMDYDKNVKLALSLGFEEVCDEKAYRGKYYIKDGLFWIHDIEALKTRLNIDEDDELRQAGYDVGSYYYYVGYGYGIVGRELAQKLIEARIYSDDSALSGKYYLLSDKKILQEMIDLASEGFDEEVLVDFVHQIYKK